MKFSLGLYGFEFVMSFIVGIGVVVCVCRLELCEFECWFVVRRGRDGVCGSW